VIGPSHQAAACQFGGGKFRQDEPAVHAGSEETQGILYLLMLEVLPGVQNPGHLLLLLLLMVTAVVPALCYVGCAAQLSVSIVATTCWQMNPDILVLVLWPGWHQVSCAKLVAAAAAQHQPGDANFELRLQSRGRSQ
jgi:hypothetical protein